MRGAGIENRLCQQADFIFRRLIGLRPWEIVVNDTDGIHVSTFKSSRDGAHPRHMHA